MDDDKSTDTGTDSTDTSTNEDTQDTDGELEDIEVTAEELGDETPVETKEAEDSKTEDEDTAPVESDEESKEDDAADTEEQSEEEVADEDTKEADTTSEAERKRQNDEFAKKRIAEREANKAKAQSEYLDDAEDDKDLALRQLQVDAYNNRVERNTNKLQNDVERAFGTIDLFSKGSPEVKEELARRVEDFERMYVKYDQNGDPVEVNGNLYQYLQTEADSIRRITGVGARQQEKDKSNTKSRTTTPPAKTPKLPAKDPDLEAFDQEAKRY